ncbi:hypothetical protein C8R43DRAFT_1142940 [Mycena crocata]|nr:hypothetical protein C8R43DRAFT_1142940 [Mycena crocata]
MGLLVTSPSTNPVPLSSTPDAPLPPGLLSSERVNALYLRRDHQGTMVVLLSLSPLPPRRHFIFPSGHLVDVCVFVPYCPTPYFPTIEFLHRCKGILTSQTNLIIRIGADTSRAVAAIVLKIINTVWTQYQIHIHLTRCMYRDIKGDMYAVERTIWVLDPTTSGYVPVKQFEIGFSTNVPHRQRNYRDKWWRCSDIKHIDYSEVDEPSTKNPIEHYKRAINAGKCKATFNDDAAARKVRRLPTSEDSKCTAD